MTAWQKSRCRMSRRLRQVLRPRALRLRHRHPGDEAIEASHAVWDAGNENSLELPR